MQFAAVQIVKELLKLSRRIHVLGVIKQVHVSKRIDGNQRQIRLGLAQVMQGMGKLLSIGR